MTVAEVPALAQPAVLIIRESGVELRGLGR